MCTPAPCAVSRLNAAAQHQPPTTAVIRVEGAGVHPRVSCSMSWAVTTDPACAQYSSAAWYRRVGRGDGTVVICCHGRAAATTATLHVVAARRRGRRPRGPPRRRRRRRPPPRRIASHQRGSGGACSGNARGGNCDNRQADPRLASHRLQHAACGMPTSRPGGLRGQCNFADVHRRSS
jgi:hypothetical protein